MACKAVPVQPFQLKFSEDKTDALFIRSS